VCRYYLQAPPALFWRTATFCRNALTLLRSCFSFDICRSWSTCEPASLISFIDCSIRRRTKLSSYRPKSHPSSYPVVCRSKGINHHHIPHLHVSYYRVSCFSEYVHRHSENPLQHCIWYCHKFHCWVSRLLKSLLASCILYCSSL
jgi:hypothetical protein